jgi:acyl carrier protein
VPQIQDQILRVFSEVADMRGLSISAAVTEETLLLDTGMDSLGFAAVVGRLEEVLGYDPFVLMEEPTYPQTFGEFVTIYERYKPN